MNHNGDSPGGLMATGLFSFSGAARVCGSDGATWRASREEGAGPQLAPPRLGARFVCTSGSPICVRPGGAVHLAVFNKSPDREGQTLIPSRRIRLTGNTGRALIRNRAINKPKQLRAVTAFVAMQKSREGIGCLPASESAASCAARRTR
jgi:hypothetical protein